MGHSPHHIKTTHQFVEHIKSVDLLPREAMISYDVKALFKSVQVDPAISIVQNRIHQEPLLLQGTSMFIPQIITLLEFCLKTLTSYSRVSIMKGLWCSHDFPHWAFITNLFMEEFEVKAIGSAPTSPCMAQVFG